MVQVGVESENGWRPARLADNPGLLVWKTVPGTTVSLQVMRGLPEVFLIAWAADWNAYIEPLRDTDSASFTPTNSVATSNHLNGTACDLNWNSHPFPIRGSLNAAQMAVLRQMLAFYEGWIFWAGDWNDPVDEMHSQMGYNTWNRNTAALDFIARKIRSDGFSTFRRKVLSPTDPPAQNGTPTAPPPNIPDTPDQDGVDPVDSIADVLYDAIPVIDEDQAARLAPLILVGLKAAQCTNIRRIAMYLAQIGHESGGFIYTEEIAKNGRYAPYIGRTWIQVTWDYNYRAFGKWCVQQGLLDDPEYFIKNPVRLADDKWAGLGPAWYWTVARPTINALSDQGNIREVTRLINGGYNGMDDRQQRYDQAIALGDRLLLLTGDGEDDWMAGVDADRLNKAVDKILGGGSAPDGWQSRAGLADFAGPVDDTVGMLLNVDGNVWDTKLILGALLGVPYAVDQIERAAAGDFPKDSFVAGNEFVREIAQDFALALKPLTGKLADLLSGSAALKKTVAPAAKKAVARKPRKKTP